MNNSTHAWTSFVWESIVPHPANEVFAWHTQPGAFTRFNPPWRPVRIVQAPRSLKDGEIVEIAIPIVGPIGIPWKLKHIDFRENQQFCDQQISGPFITWKHTHKFIEHDAHSCLMRDEIVFKTPCSLSIVDLAIKRELARLFSYRHRVLRDDMLLHARWKNEPRKTILISGSSGFIGSALVAFLSTAGHKVLKLVRHSPRDSNERFWDPKSGSLLESVFEGVDVVIHLGGANIVGKKWSKEYKREILTSRTETSALLCKTISKLERKPEAVIVASAIGIYGDTANTIVDEFSPAGRGFLAEVGQAWEESARNALNESTRLVQLRIGTVLSADGGALKKMLPAFKLGGGGVLGNGAQYMSWIALEDLLGIFEHVIYTTSMRGAFNAVSPNASTNYEFTKTLGKVLHRPTLARVPAPILRAVFGEVADAILLASSRVAPRRLIESGYEFLYPELEGALRAGVG